MVSITINIKAGSESRITDAFKSVYPITKIDGVNSFTDAAWAKEKVKEWIKEIVIQAETITAMDAIDVTVEEDVIF